MPSSGATGRVRDLRRGQSVVEFALVAPLLVILFVAVADFARLYTTMIAVESAAREAADYGTLYPWWWEGDPTDPTSNAGKTVAEMERRACVAASDLPDYVGPDDSCANPAFSYDVIEPAGVTDCSSVPRDDDPCLVEVTLDYEFNLIAPVNIRIGDVQVGFPSQIAFQRTSTFAVSDFELDQGTPGP